MRLSALFLLIGATVIIIQGCGMHTRMIPVTENTLYPYLYKKQVWTIEDANHKVNVIGNVVVRKDSIAGNLYALQTADHPSNKRLFPRTNWPHSGLYVHLNSTMNEIPGDMAIPLSNVTTATTHERGPDGRTILFIILALFLLILATS